MNSSPSPAQKIRPSRWYYLIAAALIAAGGLSFYKIVVAAIHTMDSGLTRGTFPGELTATFAAPGNYEIYYEEHSELGGRVFDTGSRVPGLKFTVTDGARGEEIPLHAPRMHETYEMNGRTGRSVLEFYVSKPGDYKVAARYGDSEQHEDAVFAVGNPQIGRFMVLVIGGIFVIFACGGGALLVIVLIEVRRSGAKRKMKAAEMAGTVAPPTNGDTANAR
jgi:hypothetical protein